jgi:hypothetical protein
MKKIKMIILTIILQILILLSVCSAAHYIVGYVEDAKDGTSANEHTILLWNPSVGIQENLTDIIGPNGNSHVSNVYMIDCELLQSGCNINNNLTLKIINNGDNYISGEINVTITGAGYDVVNNITLNSPPSTVLNYPSNQDKISELQIEFNCSVFDYDDNLKEVSLYGNWTGEWVLNETREIGVGEKFIIFTKNILQGFYNYNCKVVDTLSISSFSPQNNSFTIDLTPPIIESVLGNISYSCGDTNKIKINCTAYDELLNVDKIIIQSISPGGITNYSGSILEENTYYAEIILNELGTWKFNCIANDSAGNVNNLTSEDFFVYSNLPDLAINASSINLSEDDPIENQLVEINVEIKNIGCENTENVLISFFEGDPLESGINIGNKAINISQISSTLTNISWNTKIGPNNIYIFADYDDKITEENEENNKENKTISIKAWQDIYGNTSVDKIIGGETVNIKKWFNESYLEGNIFITDSECTVNWLSLQAIGRAKNGEESSNDFLEIDELLGMGNFEDSVSNTFSENQNPRGVQSIIIYQKEISNIPVISSTESSEFVTGILWDSSDDEIGGEFDTGDKEDIVFVTPIKKDTEGTYGFYDYEIKIPSRLREYYDVDSEEVYLYYDLN